MKVACQICNKISDTMSILKEHHAFKYSIEIDSEPYMRTACTTIETGYICFDCQEKIKQLLEI